MNNELETRVSGLPVGLVDFARDGVDLSVVEPKIRALVQALNGEACTTIASCEGHPSGGRTPYVLMHCAVPFAAALERRVSELHMKRGVLHYFWTLQGIFDPQFRLCFRLYSPELDRRTASLVQSVRLLRLDRNRVDSDLLVLAGEAESLIGELCSG